MEENNEVLGPKKFNGQAIASFVCSLVGLIVAGIPCGVAAIITGIMAVTKFNPETQKGKWMAIFGIILGAIDAVLVTIALPIILANM